MKLKIVNIVTDHGYGGIRKVAEFIDTQLSSNEIDSSTIALDEFRSNSSSLWLVNWILIWFRLRKKLNNTFNNIIIVHHPIACLLLPFNFNFKIVYVLHGPLYPKYKITNFFKISIKNIIQFLALLRSSKIISVSYGILNDLPRFLISKSSVIHNAPSLSFYRLNNKIHLFQYLFHYSGIRLVNYGRFCYQKNQEYCIQILIELKKLGIKTQLYLIGSGDTYELLQSIALKAGLKICDHDMIPNEEYDLVFTGSMNGLGWIHDYFDVAIFPSRFEGFPISLMECLSVKIPVIFSDCCYGPKEQFQKLATYYGNDEEASLHLKLMGATVEGSDNVHAWLSAIIDFKKLGKPPLISYLKPENLFEEMSLSWKIFLKNLI